MWVGLKVAPLLQALGPWTLALGLSAGPGPWQEAEDTGSAGLDLAGDGLSQRLPGWLLAQNGE